MIGFATNNLVPARLGELARAYLGRHRTGVRKTFFIATIFFERVFDGLVLIVILFACPRGYPCQSGAERFSSLRRSSFLGLQVESPSSRPVSISPWLCLVGSPGSFPERVGFWMSSAFEMFLMGLESMRRFQRVGAVGHFMHNMAAGRLVLLSAGARI